MSDQKEMKETNDTKHFESMPDDNPYDLLNRTMDVISDQFFYKDTKGIYLACNKAFAEHIGLNKEDIIGKTDFELMSREEAEFNRRDYFSVIDSGIPQRSETKTERSDGSILLVEYCLSPHRNDMGEIVGIAAIGRDISQRKSIEDNIQHENAELQQQVAERTDELLKVNRKLLAEIGEREKTEEALRISEQRFRRIFETANEGIWVVDDQNRTILVNKKMADMLGHTVDDMINQSPVKFMFPEDIPEYDARMDLRRQGVRENFVRRYRHAEGHALWFKISAAPLLDRLRTFQGSVAMLTDITAWKKTEEALQMKDSAINSSVSAIYFLDPQGRITYANPICVAMIGAESEKELIGKDIVSFASDVSKAEEIRCSLAEKGSWIGEIKVTRKSGSTVYLQYSTNLVLDSNNKLLCVMGSFIDITKSKQMEIDLRRSEKLYRSVVENIYDTFYRTDIMGRLVMLSPSCSRLLRREYTDDMLGAYVGSLFRCPKEDRKRLETTLEEQGFVTDFEFALERADGSFLDVSVTSHKYFDENGIELGVEGIIRDISERRRIEKTLRNSEMKFRSLTEISASAIFIIKNRKFFYVNPAFESISGYNVQDLSNMNIWDIIHPESRFMDEESALRLLEGRQGYSRYEIKIMTKEAQERWIDLTMSLFSIDNEQALMGQAFDITDRKRAEDNLRQSEEKYRSIIENIEDGYLEADLRGNVTYCNDCVVRMYGYQREKLVGMNYRDYTTAETAEKVYRAYNELYRTGKPVKMLDHEIIHQDGSIAHVEVSASLIRDLSNKPVGFRSIVRDITDRKKMELEQAKLKEQLYQAQKMEAIGTLASGIAHDFNNLLMGIQGYASLVLLKADKNFPHQDKLKAIEAKVQSGAELTRQLLGFSRKGSYEMTTANINELVHNTAAMFGRTKKEISIHEAYDKDAWNVDSDLSQIEQVLLNLYVNAWQAMPGGGQLYLETKNIILDEKYKKTFDVEAGRYVKISVTDSGIGMNEKTKERVFEPFFTTRDVGRGGGLGLATAYGIIRGHKGVINVYSEKGHGTTFNIYLPASDREIDVGKHKAMALKEGRETVLVVDDEEYILDVTTELLESIGYRVVKAKSGEEALEIYKKQRKEIDLLILDMIMPGMGGGDTFDRLKRINGNVKVILASGYSLNAQAVGILDRGCRAFMQKPFGLTDLSAKVREVLDNK